MRIWRWVVVTVGALGVAVVGACNGGVDGAAPSATNAPMAEPTVELATTIGGAGGALASPDGAGVTIPVGALAADVRITLGTTTTLVLPAERRAVGPALVLGPPGLRFATPAIVTLTVDPGTAVGDVRVLRSADGITGWEALPTGTVDARRVKAETEHFSVFVPVLDSGSSPSPPSAGGLACTRVTCANYAPNRCGALPDGCGGTLDCACGTSVPDGSDAASTCRRRTCVDIAAPRACGDFDDACGGTITCRAECTGCDGGGCKPGDVCTPKTCAAFGPSACGTFGDGCGGALRCTAGCTDAGSAGCAPPICREFFGRRCDDGTSFPFPFCGVTGLCSELRHCEKAGGGCAGPPVTCAPDECARKIGACGEDVVCAGGCPAACEPPRCDPTSCNTLPDSCGRPFVCNGGCPTAACVPRNCALRQQQCPVTEEPDGCGGTMRCLCSGI